MKDSGNSMRADQIEVGDFVDIAERNGPYWIEVTGLTVCDEDDEWEEHCDYDGACDLVLLLDPVEQGDPYTWHLVADQTVNVLRVDHEVPELCDRCGRPGKLTLDPYAREVNNEEVEVVLCDEHEQRRYEDV